MKTFEELPVWQAGRELVNKVYVFTRTRPCNADPGFCDQIRRAAVSVTSNIAEGHERGTTPDLIQFLFYAKGSAGEVRSQLWNAEDIGYLSADNANALRELSSDISRQLSNWIQSMQTPNFKGGPKYHKELDTTWSKFAAKAGLERQADGRYKTLKETPAVYGKQNAPETHGKQENGKQENGKRKTGKRK